VMLQCKATQPKSERCYTGMRTEISTSRLYRLLPHTMRVAGIGASFVKAAAGKYGVALRFQVLLPPFNTVSLSLDSRPSWETPSI